MKNSFSTFAFFSLLFFTSYAQDNNKPEANSFGLQYGVNFNGTVNQAVQLSGWIKNGIEIRGSMTFSYSNSQTSSINTTNTVYTTDHTYIPSVETISNSSASLTLTPTLSVVKHFPVIGNLDFYAGGGFNFGLTIPTAWTKSSNTTVADSFYSYNSTSTKGPISLNWGFSLSAGANYFFYKNLAIGADFGLGFLATNSKGNYQEQDVYINNGLLNPSTNNSTRNVSTQNTTNKYAASLTGNAGLHLTYYLRVKPKKKSGGQKM